MARSGKHADGQVRGWLRALRDLLTNRPLLLLVLLGLGLLAGLVELLAGFVRDALG